MGRTLLNVQPNDELKFPFELRRQVSSTFVLVNKTSEFVAFKVKTTSPKKYCVRPNTGTIPPQSSQDISVTMQAQKEAPTDAQSKDKFLVQSVVNPGSNATEPPTDLFAKESGREIFEHKLRVVFTPPSAPISPILEDGEPSADNDNDLVSKDGTMSNAYAISSPHSDPAALQNKLREMRVALSDATQDRNVARTDVEKLKRELVHMKQQQYSLQAKASSSNRWSFPSLLIVSFICFLLGYYWASRA